MLSVSIPNLIEAMYSFGRFRNLFENFVALFKRRMMSPDAAGSSVPLCPILSKKKLF